MNHSTPAKQLDQFIEICRRNNLKITPQRTAIYQAAVNAENHPSADDIFRIVSREFPSISFDTVNRTLLTLTKIRLLTVAESYKGARRFDPNVEDHHHMHCLKCGKIVDFTSDEFNKLLAPEQLKNKFPRVFSSRVVFNGICEDCDNKG
ncbi:MAG: Fur family transcriptional regulator [candidate division KSB1 bacterium]|jgi:Fur family peroxide stress response transcriptional regulator|nr:Fur family transcriptional regulator [candidate division KSB1 bacterium]